jgi:RHS repeat-associated protein
VRWADGDINHEGITFPTEGDRESWDDVGRRVPVSVGRPGSSVGRPDFGGGEFVGLGSGDHAGWSPGARTDPVTVTISGTGSGALTTVTSSPGGITCAGSTVSCTGWFQEGTSVTLTATVGANGPTFLGWTGACSGTGSCVLFIQGSQTVGAVFGTGLEFYHLDVLGSVRMVTNMAGAVVKRHDYFAFGEDIAAMTGDPRRFTGKELDPETALHYFGARYYRNLWGRFTSVDPVMDADEAVIDPQRWNRYSYVTNRPTQFVDPDGRAQERFEHQQDRLVKAYLEGKISKEDYMRLSIGGPKQVGIVGTAIAVVATLVFVGGGAVIAGGTTCAMTPSCNQAVRIAIEGLAPGASVPSGAELLEQAVKAGRNGVSAAGSALQSHASRAGSWLEGLAHGGNAAKNTDARKALNEILTFGQATTYLHNVFGQVISVRLPDGRGALWDIRGNFITFLEGYGK